MSTRMLRRTFATAGVGALIVGAVALGGPARAADNGSASTPKPDTAVIGCAVAVDVKDAVEPAPLEAAVTVDAGEVHATLVPTDGSVALPPTDGQPVEVIEVDAAQLPDCSAAG